MVDPTRQDELNQLDRLRAAADRLYQAQCLLRSGTALLYEAAAYELRFGGHSRLGSTARKMDRLIWEIGNRLPGLRGTASGLADKLEEDGVDTDG